jgi:hypothetical protein
MTYGAIRVKFGLKDRVTVILPDKEVELGVLEPSDQILVGIRQTAAGREFNAYKVPESEIPPEQRGTWIQMRRPSSST